ncbi:hypothetical protein [Xenorhabdus sp. KJ12.1]|uniref:hypothetical protein n=1 Tax=Xenorhabdus sp. KJ12.1 TaxID=1851571 RepID=UPI000C047A0F|nr:hypothetical protein [Xenorhabdus sp. KJ12.1]PHM72342.1 hypothetical protein Xekj_00621 [Xenorhabdus sp. KJ12.1]
MISLSDADKELLKKCIGEKLLKINGLIHYFDKEPRFDSPQKLELFFSGLKRSIIFRCSSDGESITISENPMEEIDLGEYGEDKIVDLSFLSSINDCYNNIVSDVFLIYSDLEKTYIGVKFSFIEDSNLIIANVGDDLYMFETATLPHEKEECISHISMKNN